ncbi:hypothetical protein [Pandoraea bronchicola]|uniref:hypothetical protein n=1 Tax=Pandoraea bronchicola TaxID=2508287 RepID=UPI001FE2632F|nr:hypothetical protein [Pandoraea bronchicola]
MSVLIAALGVVMALGACAGPPANERETGSAGQLFRYSSRQVSVDLTDAQRETLRSLRDRRFAESTSAQMLDAIAATLSKQGFAPVTVDRDTEVVEAERHTVLVPKWREILRGALKSRIGGLPAKPDHERLAAIVAVRPAGEVRGLLVRVRFDRTVWDSNGDARTETVLERDVYDGFFAGIDTSLKGGANPSQ